MTARLHIHPERPALDWQEFISTPTIHPPGSIALDGYVYGAPRFTADGPYLNMNHHEDVNRLATRSTSEQTMMNLNMGLERSFMVKGIFSPDVFVNDCDQDVCLSWYLLSQPNFVGSKNTNNQARRLGELVVQSGLLDTTAGAYPLAPNLELREQANWIYEPYNSFRMSGRMAEKDSDEYRRVIENVCGRISVYLMGHAYRLPLDTRYQTVGGGPGWTMFESIGLEGRTGAIADGVEAYVMVQPTGESRWRYSLGRLSEFVPFDIPKLLEALNEAESNPNDPWGGASTIAGSPRTSDSKLTPDQVVEIVNSVINPPKNN